MAASDLPLAGAVNVKILYLGVLYSSGFFLGVRYLRVFLVWCFLFGFFYWRVGYLRVFYVRDLHFIVFYLRVVA